MIYSQLEEQTEKFLQNPKKGILIEETRRREKIAHIPELFKDHRSEFNNGDIRRFLNLYVPLGKAKIADKYRKHDWHLNAEHINQLTEYNTNTKSTH